MSKHIKVFLERIGRLLEVSTVSELGEQVHDFYKSLNDIVATHPAFAGTNSSVSKLSLISDCALS